MALAAAVLKAVNTSLYGLSGRVQIGAAVDHLSRHARGRGHHAGVRPARGVSAGARTRRRCGARRAARRDHGAPGAGRCRWMPGPRIRPACSKSAARRCCCAMRPITTARCCARPPTTRRCANSRPPGFGVSHDALGAALCESWGLSGAAVACVRHHVQAQAEHLLPPALKRRDILALSVLAHTMMTAPDALDERVQRIAPQCDIDTHGLLRAARRVHEQLQDALADAPLKARAEPGHRRVRKAPTPRGARARYARTRRRRSAVLIDSKPGGSTMSAHPNPVGPARAAAPVSLGTHSARPRGADAADGRRRAARVHLARG